MDDAAIHQKIKAIASGNPGVKELQFIRDDPEGVEWFNLADARLNHVWRVRSRDLRESVIIKYSPPYARCAGPGLPLSQTRNIVEYRAMLRLYQIAPDFTPEPFCLDAVNNAFVMSDIGDVDCQGEDIIRGQLNKESVQELGRLLAKIANETQQSNMTREEFAKLESEFQDRTMDNFLCNHLFRTQFLESHEMTRIVPEARPAFQKLVNKKALLEPFFEKFYRLMTEKRECLHHGDVNSNSVLVKNGKYIITDMEFAGMGPFCYDITSQLIFLVFGYARHLVLGNKAEAAHLVDMITTILEAYIDEVRKGGKDDAYISDMMTEIAGFTGVETIRPPYCVAVYRELEDVPDAKRLSIEIGIRLLENHHHITTPGKFIVMMTKD